MADGHQNSPERILGITRTQHLAELDDPNGNLRRTLAAMEASGIMDCYVVLDTGSVDGADTAGKPEVRRIGEVDVTIVHDSNPTSPTAMNTALDALERADDGSKPAFTHFFAVSKEVDFDPEDVEMLRAAHHSTEGLLVAGTRLSTPADPELDAFLRAYHEDTESVAYHVPWNTFALWNLKYFRRYVHRFDEITEWDGRSTVETVRGEGRLQGMEDGLAVARAAHYFGLKFALLPDTVQWDVDPEKHKSHLDKLARKTAVLLEFMRIRGYSLDRLRAADVSPKA